MSADSSTQYPQIHRPEAEPLIDEYSDEWSGQVGKREQDSLESWSAKQIVNILLGACIGSFLEFYAFGLVAYFETELKQAYFAPVSKEYDQLLQNFILYGIAFAVRPIGGLLFGYIGDRYGRVVSLRASLIFMAVATFLCGVLPSYASIGSASSVFICLCRVMQGLCVGGEMPTALVYIIEQAPSTLKCTLTGCLYATSCGGYAALAAYLLYKDSIESVSAQSSDWTWRLAFICSILIAIVGIILRRIMPNSYQFEMASEKGAILSNPIGKVFTDFLPEFAILAIAFSAAPVINVSGAVWYPAYVSASLSTGLQRYAHYAQLLNGALSLVLIIASGYVCDRFFSVYQFVKYSMPVALAVVFVCYALLGLTQNLYVMCVAQLCLAFSTFGCLSCVYWSALWVPDARIRNTLTGISYNVGMAVFVSSLFDAQTNLASLDTLLGGMYAGLYLIAIGFFSLGAIVYAQNCHTWKNYHFYGPANPTTMNRHDHMVVDDNVMENPYSAI